MSEELRQLSDIRRTSFNKYAEVVTTISAGMLTIMITFMESIKEDKTHIGWLVAGWSCFMICIILGSFYLLRDTAIATKGYQLLEKNPKAENIPAPWYFIWIQNAIPSFFVGGIVSLFVFALFNIWV
jgi:hypothetical protein